MNLRITLLAAVAAIGLAACETPTAGGIDPNAPQVPFEVGSEVIDPFDAARLFGQICGANWPSFRGSTALLNSGPFIYSTAYDMYGHRRYDLSIAIDHPRAEAGCSIIFSSRTFDERIFAALQVAGAASGGEVLLYEPNLSDNGLYYFLAVVTPNRGG